MIGDLGRVDIKSVDSSIGMETELEMRREVRTA